MHAAPQFWHCWAAIGGLPGAPRGALSGRAKAGACAGLTMRAWQSHLWLSLLLGCPPARCPLACGPHHEPHCGRQVSRACRAGVWLGVSGQQ